VALEKKTVPITAIGGIIAVSAEARELKPLKPRKLNEQAKYLFCRVYKYC